MKQVFRRERGFALWVMLFMLALSFGVYLAANASGTRNSREAALAATLLRAKEALLARAVNDQNRPGSLPCPDRVTDIPEMDNHPGDGKADMLAGNHCPTYLGWLPWLTLDLPELTDDGENHLWYALAPSLRDDDSAQPINSDTAVSLEVDGQNDIAAIVIAPGNAIGQQQRPSREPADYLESNQGLSGKFLSDPKKTGTNDRLLVITRAELMAAVGKRLAGELRNCLEEHADSSSNPEHRYPWPAPLETSLAHGVVGRHFGRVADTQSNAGAEAALGRNLEQLHLARRQLAGTLDAQQQMQALKTLGDAAMQARQLFDAIYMVSSRLKLAVDETAGQLHPMGTAIDAALTNGRISRSEGSAIRSLGADSSPSLENLPALLGELGIDAFPVELARRRTALAGAQTPEELLERVAGMRDLLAITYSPRADLAVPLAAAGSAATTAQEAASAAQSGDAALLKAAKAAAIALLETTDNLDKAVAASRLEFTAGQVEDISGALEKLNETFGTSGNLAALLAGLTNTRQLIGQLDSGLPAIAAARDSSIDALDTAILIGRSARPDPLEIGTNTLHAIAQTKLLGAAIAANEANDNNLSRSSLRRAISKHQAAQLQFTGMDTATPRPPQSDILPYAEVLGDATTHIESWLGILAVSSGAAAPQAKAKAAPSEQAIADATPLDDSAYAAAGNLLDSISGNRKSASAVQNYIAQPNEENLAKAGAAIAQTLERTAQLISQADRLAGNIKGGTASAFPMVWNSARCDFLRPGQRTWWHDNRWSETLFYQMSAPLKAAPGTLTVDATGPYRLVVLSAGPSLAGQSRKVANIANFLEGVNASPTRDGAAISPHRHFSAAAPGREFNDRLSY